MDHSLCKEISVEPMALDGCPNQVAMVEEKMLHQERSRLVAPNPSVIESLGPPTKSMPEPDAARARRCRRASGQSAGVDIGAAPGRAGAGSMPAAGLVAGVASSRVTMHSGSWSGRRSDGGWPGNVES